MSKSTWGGHRHNAGRKPAPPHLSQNNIVINVRELTKQQRETLMRIINEWLAQQKEEQTKWKHIANGTDSTRPNGQNEN